MERGPIQDGVIRRITRSLSLVTSAPMPGPPKFRFSTEDLRELHNPKNIRAFLEAGGVRGLVSGLKTDRTDGIGAVATPTDQPLRHTSSQLRTGAPSATSASDLDGSSRSSTVDVSSRASTAAAIDPGLVAERRAIFGSNTLPTRKPPHLLQLLWNAYNDRVLFLLTAAALVSLAIGLYQSFTSDHGPGNPPIEWVSGAAILIAISIIVLVSTINDWEKWRQFRMLNQKQLERDVRVIRSGYASLLPRDEVVVGDVVRLESGDVVPADGIFIDGYNIACDESNATGQSGLVHKTPGDEVYDELKRRGQPISSEPQPGLDPFMLSGTRVLEGVGSFLVTCTGNKSTYGKLLSSLKYEEDPTPLQRRLSVLAQQMVYVGGAVSILLFIALLIIFCVGLSNDTRSPTERGQAFVGIVITCLTVLVIAMPEGVPLAATLSLAYGTTRMVKEHNLVRQLKGCETMGNVTSICSDIVGTLTQNKVTVVSAMVGSNIKFHDQPIPADAAGDAASHTPAQFVSRLAADVQRDLRESIALNTTAFEGERGSSFVGAHTEVAFLTFAREHLHMGPLRLEKDSADVVQLIPFSPTRQCMAAVVKRPSSALPFRVFVKGASEFLLSKCTRIVLDPRLDAADGALTAHDRKAVLDAIGAFTGRGLQTVSLVYRDLPWFERDSESADPDPQAALDHLLQEMTFLSVFGMHDPVRLGLRESVKQCHEAGVAVRIVTGDNLLTAKIITEQCGIYSPDGDDLAMEGADFRALDDEQLRDRVPRLKVLAGCSPQDKEWLVEQLKRRKEIVAVTGYSTSDVPAMVAADVSLSIGSANGTEVARQASSIILMQGDFTSIVRCITWGRAVNSSVKKFLLVREVIPPFWPMGLDHSFSNQVRSSKYRLPSP